MQQMGGDRSKLEHYKSSYQWRELEKETRWGKKCGWLRPRSACEHHVWHRDLPPYDSNTSVFCTVPGFSSTLIDSRKVHIDALLESFAKA